MAGMRYQTLLVEINSAIGIVWMNRPERSNALDGPMIAELIAALGALNDDSAVRAVILAGAGDSFCAGAGRERMEHMAGCSFEENHADALQFATLLSTIDTLGKPTIARVHGPVFAEGVGLVAACDIAVADYAAEFCLPEVRFGLFPATSGPYLIRAMGERAARRYCLTAESFTAAEAYRIGLVSEIAPPDELDARINELLGELIQGGPAAQALSREWLRTAAAVPITPDLIGESANRLAAARTSEEAREGLRSFIDKRKPAWLLKKKKTSPPKTAAPKANSKNQ